MSSGNGHNSSQTVLHAMLELQDLNAHMSQLQTRQKELLTIITSQIALSAFDPQTIKQLSAVREAIGA
jgi:hypothetical protein